MFEIVMYCQYRIKPSFRIVIPSYLYIITDEHRAFINKHYRVDQNI